MSFAQPEIVVTDQVDERIHQVIGEGLNQFNDAIAGYGDRHALAVVLKNPDNGEPLGGALGRSSLGLLFLELFFLPASLRGDGLGTRILAAFEEEGRRRGCRSAVLYTISFQAPGFYERNGWRAFGEILCDPPGASRIFMCKDLTAKAPSTDAG